MQKLVTSNTCFVFSNFVFYLKYEYLLTTKYNLFWNEDKIYPALKLQEISYIDNIISNILWMYKVNYNCKWVFTVKLPVFQLMRVIYVLLNNIGNFSDFKPSHDWNNYLTFKWAITQIFISWLNRLKKYK